MYKLFQIGSLPTNCYVVTDDKHNAIVIDVAESGYEQIADYLRKEKLVLRGILLTHGHFDHVGGVDPFLDSYYREKISGYDGNLSGVDEKDKIHVYVEEKDIDYCHRAAYCAGVWGVKAADCNTAEPLPEGEIVFADGSIKVSYIKTPGHSEGSVIYFIDGLMFSGDTLFAGSVGRTDFPQGSSRKLNESLKLIRRIDGDYRVLSGHGRETTLGREKDVNIWLK